MIKLTEQLRFNNNFIVVDGVNGAGKTTLITKIAEYLKEKNKEVLLSREPGAGELGQTIRELVINNKQKLASRTELFLFAADRNNHVNQIILPALANNKIVISDRYYYSTTAFQGYGRGLNLDLINQINTIAIEELKPGLVFLLDLDPQTGLARNKAGEKERDSFEEEELAFHERIRTGFLRQAEELTEQFIVLNAANSPEQVWKEAKAALDVYFF